MNGNALHSVLKLIRTGNIGPTTFSKLIERFSTAEAAIEALPELSRKYKTRSYRLPSDGQIQKEIDALSDLGGRFVSIFDPEYPGLLSHIDDAPPVLALRGNIELLTKPTVAIVGARNSSLNARNLANSLAADLAASDLSIVSGLAKGIDTAAHVGSLKHGTIAVIAGGADVIYPRENTKLHAQICETGLLIAEDPLGSQPTAQAFPRRNRIISGLSLGVIVMEAAKRSGTLITARLASEQGRDVFAIPGFPLDPRAEGTNHLIQQGAYLVTSAQDVLQLLSKEPLLREARSPVPKQANLSLFSSENDTERAGSEILALMNDTPVHLDDIARETGLEAALLSATLTELELVGKIERLPGNRVAPVL